MFETFTEFWFDTATVAFRPNGDAGSGDPPDAAY
jgi:hypothetical protein